VKNRLLDESEQGYPGWTCECGADSHFHESLGGADNDRIRHRIFTCPLLTSEVDHPDA
jgi:hypothetical protein